MVERHKKIKIKLIEASYKSIDHLQSVLEEPILMGDPEDLSPDKFMNAVRAKKQAQMDAFEMLENIEAAQMSIDSLDKEISKKQLKINEASKGFAENNAV